MLKEKLCNLKIIWWNWIMKTQTYNWLQNRQMNLSWWRTKIINKRSCVYLTIYIAPFILEHDHLYNRSKKVNHKISWKCCWPVGAGLQDRPVYRCSLSSASSSPSTDLSRSLFLESEKQTKHSASASLLNETHSVPLKKTSHHPPAIQFFTTLIYICWLCTQASVFNR